MSDISANAKRYDQKNTVRSDPPNPHNGELVRANAIGFDCSGFVCHVINESGYRIDYESTSAMRQSKGFISIRTEDAQPGDLVLFKGHVGIILSYDKSSTLGSFIHMSGQRNIGVIRTTRFILNHEKYSYASEAANQDVISVATNITSQKVLYILRVRTERYSAEADLHYTGQNPFPILRPLGTAIYTKHVRKKPKERVLAAAIGPKRAPVQTKSSPTRKGNEALLSRLWGDLVKTASDLRKPRPTVKSRNRKKTEPTTKLSAQMPYSEGVTSEGRFPMSLRILR